MPSFSLLTAAIAASMISGSSASIQNPEIMPTPPMGFNDWSRLECAINQSVFTDTADAMVSKGLLAAGYNRVNIDDCWMADTRTEEGKLTWNETLFPKGLPWLGQYLKEKGFHFGIYEDAGNETCGGYPGSYGYEEVDAQTFASWGIDYLKVDGCHVTPTTEVEYHKRYAAWHDAFSKMEDPLIFSQSAPAYFSLWLTGSDNLTDWYTVMDWVPYNGELARHSADVLVYVGVEGLSGWDSVMQNYNYNTQLARYQRPGYFNDPDFLIVDNLELTLTEKKSHFALWASFSAPLIISAWIPDLPEDVISYLKNSDLIKVDQDPLAQQATLVSRDDSFDVLTRSLANGDRLVTVLNRGNDTASTTVSALRLGLQATESIYSAKDLWTGEAINFKGELKINKLASHATAVYRISLSGLQSLTVFPTGMIFNAASTNCLTAGARNQEVKFTTCAGTDDQVWQIRPLTGTISPLSARNLCLTAEGGRTVLKECRLIDFAQDWEYSVRGYLTNKWTHECITEDSGSSSSKCLYEVDSQVWSLPAGVKVHW
ncbi:uncharacterized protein TRUGW13939_04927 [Talaromyces rugulosus]|uniref:Alpha-galactosidase n=1 Tax=Talaromyces rugulosus TaxID=121627 RepID=A0A7H8QV21_TALRU|nr:uncharacterized protein TRUGW13939_04927 [Talaromyces rugulosus]QKX57807.1 hypothetical protein TRUGW13939_04927 [Talaromyces rugulosus]